MSEQKIANEITKDILKHFNGKENLWTNQQMVGIREMFRGVAVKSWMSLPLERLKFVVCNKIIAREAVKFYSEYWRERCKAPNTSEHEMSSFRE